MYDVPENTDLHINALALSGNVTVVVESGSLFVDGNIANDTDSSWAFVVKQGNVVVNHAVTDMAGVFVALNGSVVSDGVSTPVQLRIDGNLYGSSADLVDNRTYVRGNTGYDAVSEGVVINYSNRAFINTPPLLNNFLELFDVRKVAK